MVKRGWKNKSWNLAIIARHWSLWLDRNNRVFEDLEGNLGFLWDSVSIDCLFGCLTLRIYGFMIFLI